uniref:CCHC-type domain-containing protein n=1 Tax=Moniliophthora roreri TaxID=221103 RepID=A0A0W0FBL2_MONRR
MWLTKLAIIGGEKVKKTIKTESKVNCISDAKAADYQQKGLCYQCGKHGHISQECLDKLKNDEKKESKQKTPKDVYHQICAIYREYSDQDQAQILDMMEEEGF